jgi:hypothetical protein
MALELFFDNSFKVLTDDFTMYLCFITLLRINKKRTPKWNPFSYILPRY